MSRRIVLAWALAAGLSSSLCLAKQPAKIASYKLEAKLNPNTHKLIAKGIITWTNPSAVPASQLYFHLYLNAFAHKNTLFLRSPFGAGRSGQKATEFGGIEVKRLSLANAPEDNLWPDLESPSGANAPDQTDVAVPLPTPVGPRETVSLSVEFEATLPEIVERTGYIGDYHFVAQWFPKLAKREQDGTWVHFSFHPQAEFYADFGDYEVTIEVPSDLMVGATGKLTKESRAGTLKRLTFVQPDVHDFAWVAWKGFSKAEEELAGVRVSLLYPQGLELERSLTFEALSRALPHFNQRYGRYPYETLTVVHPPEEAGASGGMEYPTLITTGSRGYSSLLGIKEVQTVTVHELGHQWFYGMLASNEHRWPFLDEGLTSYAESEALEALYGDASLWGLGPIQLASPSFTRALSASYGRDDTIAQPASEFVTFGCLGALVYSRTATALDTLARVYGKKRMEQALRHYAERYRFTHPEPRDLLSTLSEVLGPRALENLEAILFERASVDFAVDSVNSIERPDTKGLFDNRAVFVRRGELRMPIELDLIFSDGSRERRHWAGHEAVRAEEVSGPKRLTGAVIDPQYRVRIDDNLLNNAATTQPPSTSAVAERLSYYAALLLSLFGP